MEWKPAYQDGAGEYEWWVECQGHNDLFRRSTRCNDGSELDVEPTMLGSTELHWSVQPSTLAQLEAFAKNGRCS